MLTITSAANPVVKEVKALKSRREREEKGLFFIEGTRIVEEAFTAGVDIVSVFLSEQCQPLSRELESALKQSGCRKYTVTEKIFREMSDTETPQGILAVAGMQNRALDGEWGKEPGNHLYVLLDGVRDPGNMGTIIRTADAAGFDGIIVCRGCVDVYNPKVLRSTMGSVFHTPVYSAGAPAEAVKFLKDKGITVYASHLDGKKSIYEADLTCNAALVIGSEAEGISEETAAEASFLVRVPMPGRAESLNASVAAAVMLFESVRQRMGKSD